MEAVPDIVIVVIIRIVEERFDLLYTLLVNYVMAITFQGYFSSYICNIDDTLSIIFLVNEVLLTLSLVGVTRVKGWDCQNGAILLMIQGLLLGAYLTYIIWTIKAKPLYEGCRENCTERLAKYGSIGKQKGATHDDGLEL